MNNPGNIDEIISLGSEIGSDWQSYHAQYAGAEQTRSQWNRGRFTSKTLKQIREEYDVFYLNGFALAQKHGLHLDRLFSHDYSSVLSCLESPLDIGNRVEVERNLEAQIQILGICKRLASESYDNIREEEDIRSRLDRLLSLLRTPKPLEWWQIIVGIVALITGVVFGVLGIIR